MFRAKTIVAALVLCLGLGTAAWAQDGGWGQRDRRDNRQYGQNGVWQQNQNNDHDGDDGYRQNRRDRDRDGDRDRDRDRDRRNNGYYGNGQYGNGRVYGQGPYGNGQYGNGQVYGRGPYGNGQYGAYGNGGYAVGQAQQIGFNDGLIEGQQDAATGHSDRPTYHSNYKNATRGWNGSQVDRGSYMQAYRQAYVQGYQQGYNGGRYGNGGYGYPQGNGWPR